MWRLSLTFSPLRCPLAFVGSTDEHYFVEESQKLSRTLSFELLSDGRKNEWVRSQ